MNNRIEQLTLSKLTATFGATERWWSRKRRQLVKLGVIHKRGRVFWGRIDDIELWLAGHESAL